MPSPILFFVYKRLQSCINTINSLKNCPLAKDSILHIYSDGAKSEIDKLLVDDLRKYLFTITGFKEIIIVKRTKNFGVDYNIIEGIKEASFLYENFIIIEDDLIFSKNFLIFMNEALETYKSSKSIISISGFSFINKFPANYKYDVYFTKRSWSWGWATYSNKVQDIDWEISDFHEIENNKTLQHEFNKGGSDLYNMLKKTMQGEIRAWDIRFFYHQFKYDYLTIYPLKSKTNNLGFGKNASNTFGYNRYKTTLDVSQKKSFIFCKQILINPFINKQFVTKNNLFNRIKTRLLGYMGVK